MHRASLEKRWTKTRPSDLENCGKYKGQGRDQGHYATVLEIRSHKTTLYLYEKAAVRTPIFRRKKEYIINNATLWYMTRLIIKVIFFK